MSEQASFIGKVSAALGRRERGQPLPPDATGLSVGRDAALVQAAEVRQAMVARGVELLEALAASAAKTGWKVHRAATVEDVGEIVAAICRETAAKTALRSTHAVLEAARIDQSLATAGVSVRATQPDEGGLPLRDAAFSVDVGITGGDYAIAETGTLVLHPRRGLSRLVSVAPPRHIAVVERGTVLPSLDELFVLERADLLEGKLAGSMNLISGPSRTGDIEGTIVYGIHGPLETHMVLVG